MFEGRLTGDGRRARVSLSRKGILIIALPAAFPLILLDLGFYWMAMNRRVP